MGLPLLQALVLGSVAPVPVAPLLPGDGDAAAVLRTGPWRAWLDSPGGELPFGLELARGADGLEVRLVNGPERIPVPRIEVGEGRLVLAIDVYDSRIEASWNGTGDALEGEWTRRSGPDSVSRLAFHAEAGDLPRFAPEGAPTARAADVAGRWAVDFASDDLPAVALLEAGEGDAVTGTFLTATGDYRFLAGTLAGDRLRLSVFDGAHAFLFDARLADDGTLAGDFWSRDTWHETWTARRDPDAHVVDGFAQTAWDARVSLADLTLPDLAGRAWSLADPALAGDAMLIQLFGTWCPNCNDETAYLVELHERYAGRGLSILGLAFELTGDFERDARQVRVFAEHHGVDFPLFVAGTADKAAASAAFPAIDRLRSYPTTIFLDAAGRVRSVHSGFSGPATGEAHARLRAEFEGLIEELLAEAADDRTAEQRSDATWASLLEGGEWRPWFPPDPSLRFREASDGRRQAELWTLSNVLDRPEQAAVRIQGDAVWIGDRVLRFEAATGLLLDPRAPGRRYGPAAEAAHPDAAAAVHDLESTDALVRREALFRLAAARGPGGGLAEALPLLDDPHAGVELAAAWALGHCGEAQAIEPLLARLQHPRAALRRTAVRALADIPRTNGRIREAVEPLLEDPDPLVRAAARDVVARYGR